MLEKENCNIYVADEFSFSASQKGVPLQTPH